MGLFELEVRTNKCSCFLFEASGSVVWDQCFGLLFGQPTSGEALLVLVGAQVLMACAEWLGRWKVEWIALFRRVKRSAPLELVV